jgi:hypothetical protein
VSASTIEAVTARSKVIASLLVAIVGCVVVAILQGQGHGLLADLIGVLVLGFLLVAGLIVVTAKMTFFGFRFRKRDR